jgi:predicted esterase
MTADDSTMRQIDIETRTHGRVLIDEERSGPALQIIAGFHGYAQNAEAMLQELRAIPAPDGWTIVSIQGLHRFYRSRSDVTVASWMTRQDRELLIADNIAYVDEVLTQVAAGRPIARLVLCGFSQGAAMAFRSAARGQHRVEVVVAIGGDVPPELLADGMVSFDRVFLARGGSDALYTAHQHEADLVTLRDRCRRVDGFVFAGGHEWTEEVRQAIAQRLDD